ncbi:MAG: S41 family peptidase [Bryobacteraceae bacterium]
MPRFCLPALALLAGQLAFAQQPPNESDRLITAGKVWVTVKYFHPYLAYRDIDWDKALVDALPKIRAAGTSVEYRAAIQSMLDALHDPQTYVLPKAPQPASIRFENAPDGTPTVSQSNTPEPDRDVVQELSKAIASARSLVFDLRSGGFLSSLLSRPDLQSLLTAIPLDAPAQRLWIHNGLAPVSGMPFSAYHSAFYNKAGTHISGNSAAPERKIMFLVNENSVLPPIASALLANGKAVLRAESPHYRISGVETIAIPLDEHADAVIRLSEPLVSDKPMPPFPSPQPDRAYAENRYPSTEYRILAAYKIWGVFRYFFAYRDLMDEDWDDVFATFLPKFIAAKDAREYNLTVSEMVTHVNDSHAGIQSEELAEYFGNAPVGLRLRLIEKKPVITEILDDKAKEAGIQVGDIISKVDGEDIIERINREARYISSSTQQWLGYRVMRTLLNGPEDSMAALVVRGQDGQTLEVSLKRSSSYVKRLRDQRTGDVIKLLPDNIGYADLDRLTPEEVNGMFEKFRDTVAIVFDMRGSPHETAWAIAPRLTEEKDVAVAIFTGPLSLTPDLPHEDLLTSTASYFFVQKISQNDTWKYKGKTVMLIDERTMSQAEHTGLFLEAANKTEFIGTPSAGADGDVTNFVIPGGITISFSGNDVRHANGGKLQRLGLQPAVSVSPTIKGIREGRDEVLEKAIENVSKE